MNISNKFNNEFLLTTFNEIFEKTVALRNDISVFTSDVETSLDNEKTRIKVSIFETAGSPYFEDFHLIKEAKKIETHSDYGYLSFSLDEEKYRNNSDNEYVVFYSVSLS